MPPFADPDRRRAQIMRAVVDVVAVDGFDRVSMRTVAERAGVSLRLVQYYFTTKSELLQRTLADLETQSRERWQARLHRPESTESPKRLLETYLEEALPTDAASRRFHIVYRAFTAAALTDPTLSTEPLSDGPRRVHRQIAQTLAAAIGMDSATAALEAHRLMALEHGLSTGILTGVHDANTARCILDRHLAELFADSA